jgi:hypothetical protein
VEAEVEQYLAALVAEARSVLGDGLVGAYAAGSVALGAFEPGRSDVDVALVCSAPLSSADQQQLVARLRHEALPCPTRGLELVVYRIEVARSGTADPGFELELNSGAGMDFRVTLRPEDRPEADGRFWYALDRSILHQDGVTLLGPPAAEAFADPDPLALHGLLVTSLRWWMSLPTPPGDEPAPGAEDAVLGACRALARHRWGTWLSKVEAGRRLLLDDDERADLIRQSIAARSGSPPPSGARARDFQRGVLDELTRAVP